MILLVNKDHIFNEDMLKNLEFSDYINELDKDLLVESKTLFNFMNLKAHLKVDNIIIDIDSAYRSLESQEDLCIKYINKYGMDKMDREVAYPGFSDHHTGMGLDLVVKVNGIFTNDINLIPRETLIKIHESLKYFGFIIRYPKNKESITGFNYKPLYIRYIGDDAMNINDECLEEYLNY